MTIDKLICVGKNYLDHARELGDAVPEKPVLFLKPASILKTARSWGDQIDAVLPQNRGAVHYECEVVLRVAPDCCSFDAVSIGLDMTLRTLQADLKRQGHPWTISKVFRDAACVGPWIPLAEFKVFRTTPFQFQLNGVCRQQGKVTEMEMSPEALIDYVASCFPLCEGDLIYTGTPAGVGEVSLSARAKLSWGPYEYEVKWA